MSELQELKKEIREHGRRLDNLQAEFNSSLSFKNERNQEPPLKAKQGNDDLDASDERLAEELFQSSRGRRVNASHTREEANPDDPDERLAQAIFDAADGNTGDADSTEISDEDSRLADEIFAASGGNRT